MHTNRNKFANAFAFLLSSEVADRDDFRRVITDEQDALEDSPVNKDGSQPMEVDEGQQEESK